MNLRAGFIKLFNWCPGVASAAKLVPDKEISEQKLTIISIIAVASFFGIIVYTIQATPTSYSWNIDFTNVRLDQTTGLYVQKRTAIMDGIYNISIDVDAPINESVRIQVFRSNERHLSLDLVYVGGLFYTNGNNLLGEKANYRRGDHFPLIFKISSPTRDAVVNISVDYVGKDPYWPPGTY